MSADDTIDSLAEQCAALEAKLEKAMEELERLGFDFNSNTGRAIRPITEWPEETGNIMAGTLKGESHE